MRFMNVNQRRKLGFLLLSAALFLPITIQAHAEQWTQSTINAGNMETIAVGPKDSSAFYTGTTQYCILKSSDHGDTWISTAMPSEVHDIAVNPQVSSILYAGTSGGIYKSMDSGKTWSAVFEIEDWVYELSIAIDPQTPSTLYALVADNGVYKSTDSGKNWEKKASITQGLALAIKPDNPAVLYVGIFGSTSGVLRSADSGQTWTVINNGLPQNYMAVHDFAIDPQNSSTIYVGIDWGVYKSTNGGDTWNPTGLINKNVLTICIDPDDPDILYAGTHYDGVYKSLNGGDTWIEINNGLTNMAVGALVVDSQASSKIIYAGTYGGGLFKSLDGGNTWTAIDNGLMNLWVGDLAFDPQTSAVYAAGIFSAAPPQPDSGGGGGGGGCFVATLLGSRNDKWVTGGVILMLLGVLSAGMIVTIRGRNRT